MKSINQAFNPENQKSAFLPDPKAAKTARAISAENINMLKKIKTKQTSIITESLKTNENQKQDLDSGTMLDEKNIL
jgi:hypothetical protein